VQSVRGANGQVLVSGAGPLQNCSTPLSYRVTADAGLNPLRLVFEEVFGAIGLGNAIAPARRSRSRRPTGALGLRLAARWRGRLEHPFPAIRSGQHLLRPQAAMPHRVIAYFGKDEDRTRPFTFPQIRMIRRTRSARTIGAPRARQAEASCHSGQNTSSAGIDTAMISTSSGRPIRQ
jgi:hypothetical protein